MKQVLASLAPLIRQLPITSHNTVANRALRLSLHSLIHIPLESGQGVDQAAIEDSDSAEGRAEPRLPLLLVDSDTIDAFNARVGQRKGGWECDAHGHCLIVDGIGGGDFVGTRSDFDRERRVRLGVGPFSDGLKGCGDDWR